MCATSDDDDARTRSSVTAAKKRCRKCQRQRQRENERENAMSRQRARVLEGAAVMRVELEVCKIGVGKEGGVVLQGREGSLVTQPLIVF